MKLALRIAARLGRWLIYALLVVVILVFVALGALETGWSKNAIRQLIVRQANQYLTATLEIDELAGSFFRGIELRGVRLSRNGERLVGIDRVSLAYALRELYERGTTIRRIEVAGLRVFVARQADGRWNLGTLIKRDANEENSRGPGRPLHLQSVVLTDTSVTIGEELTFGPAHVSTAFEHIAAHFSFDYEPVQWRLNFTEASWQGRAPDLQVVKLTGAIGNAPDAWTLSNLHIVTPASDLHVTGTIDKQPNLPNELHFLSQAERFSMAEWAPTVPVLSQMAIDSRFDARLDGPVARLSTTLKLESNGGQAAGTVVIDTSTPRRVFEGQLDLARLDLAPWLGKPDQTSDITGRVRFKIGLQAGDRFPRGTYSFDGSHARFHEYEADDLKVHGEVTKHDVRIDGGTATAYGANVRLDAGSIAVDEPYKYRFAGFLDGLDLRMVPAAVPVPHVESALRLDYDVNGQFTNPFLRGSARFGASEFLGAAIAEGGTGSIDTSSTPIQYAGEGTLTDINLHRFGEGLQIAWLQEPRYAGTLNGRFAVDGQGAGATVRLTSNGHVDDATLFGGRLHDAEVTLSLSDGSLSATYDGALEHVNPKLALEDERWDAVLTGRGRAAITVDDLLTRSPALNDYTIDATATFTGSSVRGVAVDSADAAVTLKDGALHFTRFTAAGPIAEIQTTGTLDLGEDHQSDLTYTVPRARLEELKPWTGRDMSGLLVTSGRLTGSLARPHLVGQAEVSGFETAGIKALGVNVKYDATVVPSSPAQSDVEVDGEISLAQAFDQEIQRIAGKASYKAGDIEADLRITQAGGVTTLAGRAALDSAAQKVTLQSLSLSRGRVPWRLAANAAPVLGWSDRGITITGFTLTDEPTGTQRLTADGSWFPDGGGSLVVNARHVALDALTSGTGEVRYGGFVDLDATISGSRAEPHVTSRLAVTEGRVFRTPYQSLAGTVDYDRNRLRLDLRLDQSPGNYLTAIGTVPVGMLFGTRDESPIDLQVASSSISLGLIEGTTDVVRNVSGNLQVNVHVVGTAADPHFDGLVEIANGAFLVNSSGSRYKNGRLALRLGVDRVMVEAFHIEDNSGHPLELTGSLATHELRVGDLEIDAKARGFEVLHNDYGRVEVDADLQLRGQFESPLLGGRLTIAGGQLNVDNILSRTLLQPYATKPAASDTADAIAALNPWDRMSLDLQLHVPGTLRLVGDNVQVTPGTPLGLGDIRLRAIGDLFFYKGASTPVYVAGSLDSISGTYVFQGRRFDLDPFSSINFRGDLNPELYVMVTRQISGVDTRVTIAGPLNQPELRLSSTPALEPSDILALIVFNTTTNDLSTLEQQQLAVRAGTLAAGFIAAPILSALERSIGLETLEVEPGADASGGTKVTVGNELAPGLVARFSRQFGGVEYDEAQVEYILSRILRIRATFSDASPLAPRQAFRRVEPYGIDLLFFFSY